MAAPSEPSPGWAEIASSFKDLDSTPAAESKNYAPVFAALQQRVHCPICHRPSGPTRPLRQDGTTGYKTCRVASAPTSISRVRVGELSQDGGMAVVSLCASSQRIPR